MSSHTENFFIDSFSNRIDHLDTGIWKLSSVLTCPAWTMAFLCCSISQFGNDYSQGIPFEDTRPPILKINPAGMRI